MKKTIAAFTAAILLSAGAVYGGLWINEHYTFVDGSAIRDTTMNSINDYGARQGMIGYMMGEQAGALACKSKT